MSIRFDRVLRAAGLVCLFWVMAGGAHAAARLTLAYSGNLDGELEPCGCSEEGNLGGIKRQATVLDRLRAENPQLLAVSAGGLLSAEGADDQLKSAYILKGFAALGYDAIGVQWRDLAYGPEFLQQQTLPWVVSNWHDASLPPVRVIDKAGQRIAVFSWLDPDASPLRKMQGSHDLATGSPVALHRALAQAKRRGELTLLTTTLPAEGAAKLFDLEQVDILIERAGYEVYAEPRRLGRTLVLKPGSRGMRIARLDLEIADARVTGWRHQVLPMPPSIPDAPQLAAWYEEYNAAVKAAYLKVVELRKVQEDGSGPFVGAEVCAACHAQAHATWSASRHAGAYATLEAVGKAFDPGCIGCHVVGFRQPGGYFDLNLTGHLAGVQCENCHGAGRAHVESQGRTPVANRDWKPEQMCAQCHNQPHSPGFNFGTYWPKIAH